MIKLAVMAEVKTYFRPSSSTGSTKWWSSTALDEAHRQYRADQLQYLDKRLARLDMKLEVSDGALALLAEAGLIRCSVRVRSSGDSGAYREPAFQGHPGRPVSRPRTVSG